MIWLGSKHGYLSDWITQRWVQSTGRRVDLSDNDWLAGPIAPATGIGHDYFVSFAQTEGLVLDGFDRPTGIISDFSTLRSDRFDPKSVHPSVVRFYEQTSLYELDAWAEWCGIFRPFGRLLATLFSRRVQQLNVPISSLDTSRGITNDVLPFINPSSGSLRYTAWFRRLQGIGNVLYAGFYSVCCIPGHCDPCVKVVFPLPNGNAIVIMRAECCADGSFVVTSAGARFGEPGFYFTVHCASGAVWARYVPALRESICVYSAENNSVRADHVLTYFGATFLRLHYRMRAAQYTFAST